MGDLVNQGDMVVLVYLVTMVGFDWTGLDVEAGRPGIISTKGGQTRSNPRDPQGKTGISGRDFPAASPEVVLAP